MILVRVIKKIKNLIYSFVMSRFYASFGNCSRIIKPLQCSDKKYISIGKGVTIGPNALIEPIPCNIDSEGKLYKNKPEPRLCIEDNVWIGQGLHLNCARSVIIHKNALISSYVYISDLDHDYTDVEKPVGIQPLIIQSVEIGEQAFIGTGVKILAGSKIGKHSIIGANSVVTYEIPDYCVAAGIPAKIIKKYNFDTKTWEKV